MNFEKVVQRIPIALAMQVGQLPAVVRVVEKLEATEVRATTAISTDTNTTSESFSFNVPESEQVTGTFSVELPRALETWNEEIDERYHELVMKEAVGTIKNSELKELDSLQIARRKLESPPSTEEIVARNRRERLDRDLVKVLKRHVQLRPLT